MREASSKYDAKNRSDTMASALQSVKALTQLVSGLLESATVVVDNNANGLLNSANNFSRIINAQASLRARRPSELKSANGSSSPSSKPPLAKQSSSEQIPSVAEGGPVSPLFSNSDPTSPPPPTLGGYALSVEETISSLVTTIYEFHNAAVTMLESLTTQLQQHSDDSMSSPVPPVRQRPYLSIDELESLATSSSLPKNFLQSLRTALNSSSSTTSAATHHFLVSLPAQGGLSDGEGASIVELPIIPSLDNSHIHRPMPISTTNTQPPSQGQSVRSSPPAYGNMQSFDITTLPSPPEEGLLTAKPSVIAPHAPTLPIPHDTPRRQISYNSDTSKLSPPSFAMPPPAYPNFPEISHDHNIFMSVPMVLTKHATRGIDPDFGFKKINQYLMITELGRGSQGRVKLAINTETNRTVAIKSIRRTIGDKKSKQSQQHDLSIPHAAQGVVDAAERVKSLSPNASLRHEVAVAKTVRHKNILSILEVIDDPSESKLFLVMEYADKGPVAKVSADGVCTDRPSSFLKTLDVAFQAAQGLRHLHRKRILHHDVKPGNLLWDSEGTVMLSDFGVAEFRCDYTHMRDDDEDVRAVELIGVQTTTGRKQLRTPLFTAPEVLLDEKISDESFSVQAAADIWSLGATFFSISSGRVPFFLEPHGPTAGGNDEDNATFFSRLGRFIKESSANGDIQQLLNISTASCHTVDEQPCACRSVAVDWNALLVKMLDVNPTKRPSSTAVFTAIGDLLARLQDDNLLTGACRQTVIDARKQELDAAVSRMIGTSPPQALSASGVHMQFSQSGGGGSAGVYGEAVINKTSFRLLKKE